MGGLKMKLKEILFLIVMFIVVVFLTFIYIEQQNTINIVSQAKTVFKLLTAVTVTLVTAKIITGIILDKKIRHQKIENTLKKMAEKLAKEIDQQEKFKEWKK